MKKIFLLLLVSFLAACSSGVKLDDVQVEDRSGSGTGVAGSAGVAGVDGRGLEIGRAHV